MATPKRRTSKTKQRQRVASHKRPLPTVAKCANCGAPAQPHRVCRNCGNYRGRQVQVISTEE